MIEIQLSQGRVAKIDDEDFALVSTFKWSAEKRRTRATYYAYRFVMRAGKQKKIYMHRLIVGESATSVDIDHRDSDGLNNQRANLRACTRSQNNANSPSRRGSSPFKGVSFHKASNGMWKAQISANRKRIYLGIFRTEIEAAVAYNRAAKEYFGEFAFINQIQKEQYEHNTSGSEGNDLAATVSSDTY